MGTFQKLPVELQKLFASHLRPRKFAPGSDITVQGHNASKMYLLDFGKVNSPKIDKQEFLLLCVRDCTQDLRS